MAKTFWTGRTMQELIDHMNSSDLPLVRDRLQAFADKHNMAFGAVNAQYYRILTKFSEKSHGINNVPVRRFMSHTKHRRNKYESK